MKFPLGSMTVGDILDRGLKLLFARLPVFYVINLIVLTPVMLIQIAGPLVLASDEPMTTTGMLAGAGVLFLAVIVSVILQPIGTAAILFIVMEEYAGRRPTLGQAFSYA